jgi:hypothetical protein
MSTLAFRAKTICPPKLSHPLSGAHSRAAAFQARTLTAQTAFRGANCGSTLEPSSAAQAAARKFWLRGNDLKKNRPICDETTVASFFAENGILLLKSKKNIQSSI